jgi:hypothetical protein
MLQAIEEDNPTDDPEQMAMIIKDFWKQIWEERDTRPSPDHLDDYFEDYTKRIDSRSAPPIPDKETLYARPSSPPTTPARVRTGSALRCTGTSSGRPRT